MYQGHMCLRAQNAGRCYAAHVSLKGALNSAECAKKWSGLPAAVSKGMQTGVISDIFSSERAAKNAAAAHMLAVLIPSYELPELPGAVLDP